MTDPRITALFTPEQLRAAGLCTECGWHPKTQGHSPDCTREDTDGESDR